MNINDIMAEIKAKQADNPKFQAFMAAIEKRKAEMETKKEQ